MPEFAEILTNKHWVLLESDKQFYISDNPITKQNLHTKSPYGFKTKGTVIYCPISPSYVLCLMCRETYNGLHGKYVLTAENVENLNSLQVINSNRHVFSSNNNFELASDMVAKGQNISPSIRVK